MRPLLEIATFSLEAAIIAGRAGADRIELCVDYAAGGLTPPQDMIAEVVRRLTCPVFVMIRARPGNFIYSGKELEQMRQDIVSAKEAGANGFVFGILEEDGTISEPACSELVSIASPLPCTFHRAFDELAHKKEGLEKLITCGFRRVLTSGGPVSAMANPNTLKALVDQAAGRIMVVPGGGIRPSNLRQLAEFTGAMEYHSAAICGHGLLPDVEAIIQMKQSLSTLHFCDD
jgi:copper homeostasis protein